MAYYSVRFLNNNGRMTGRLQFAASTHLEAEDLVAKITDPRTKELWFGSVPIRSWPAASKEQHTGWRRQWVRP